MLNAVNLSVWSVFVESWGRGVVESWSHRVMGRGVIGSEAVLTELPVLSLFTCNTWESRHQVGSAFSSECHLLAQWSV